jgi:hypothetical protein
MIQEILKLIIKGIKALFKLAQGRRGTEMRHGEIATAGELKAKYNLHAGKRPEIKLNPNNVPIDLRDLIPQAEKWGIGDDIIRSEFQKIAKDIEKLELKTELEGRLLRINEWLDSFGNGKDMTEEAGAFMYMLLGLDEMFS